MEKPGYYWWHQPPRDRRQPVEKNEDRLAGIIRHPKAWLIGLLMIVAPSLGLTIFLIFAS